jgi:hypothetical protein
VAVVGALLAFCAVRDKLSRGPMLLLSAGFISFAAVNMSAMSDVSKQRLAVLEAVKSCPLPEKEKDDNKVVSTVRDKLQESMVAPAVSDVLIFHSICDAVIIAALWIISYKRPIRRLADVVPTKVGYDG